MGTRLRAPDVPNKHDPDLKHGATLCFQQGSELRLSRNNTKDYSSLTQTWSLEEYRAEGQAMYGIKCITGCVVLRVNWK